MRLNSRDTEARKGASAILRKARVAREALLQRHAATMCGESTDSSRIQAAALRGLP